jgi:calcineurin-like phosphoesterase family protein
MLRIKKRSKDYNKIYFCSDTHYGHNKEFLYVPRGFSSAEEHSQWISDQIDDLRSDDLLIHLGDVGLSVGFQSIYDFMLRFPCETLMVWGNHNSGVMQAYKQHLPRGFERCEIYPLKITPNITMMGSDFMLDIDQHKFYLKHMAPLIWDEQNKGRNVLCGHSHGNLKSANPGQDGIGKILDVGVENAIKQNGTIFFQLKEVCEILDSKTFNPIDHH